MVLPQSARGPSFGLAVLSLCAALFFLSCASEAASAEEYFSIGMAYYEIGKFDEAERWFNRAKSVDRTMTASEYNLGRIAFAGGRYEEAAERFESILELDRENVMALKGAAYSRIKNGDLELAEIHYEKVLSLVPESADDGYNYALVLYALEKYQDCEDILYKYDYSTEENNDALLLLARAQTAADKPEAVDSYGKLIANTTTPNPKVYEEYGKLLEKLELYAKAIEQYRAGADIPEDPTAKDDDTALKRADFLFYIARVLLTSDPENEEGITELKAAEEAGFSNADALEELLNDERIAEAHKETIRSVLYDINARNEPEAAAAETNTETETGADTNTEAAGTGAPGDPSALPPENQTETGTNTPNNGNNPVF